MIVPLLIIFFAGELVWREREARTRRDIDATPVPEWVRSSASSSDSRWCSSRSWRFMGRRVLVQVIRGFHDFEIGLYLKVLFGLQLTEYLLFAVLALVVG